MKSRHLLFLALVATWGCAQPADTSAPADNSAPADSNTTSTTAAGGEEQLTQVSVAVPGMT